MTINNAPTDDGSQRAHAKSADDFLPLVYDELRKLAARNMAQSPAGQTLQATALVHEAWLKMSKSASPQWNDRAHFFRAAAEAMRQILIDQARRKSAQKRGSNDKPEELHESQIECRAPSSEMLAVHEALDGLEAEDPLAAEVVKLRYFAGMNVAEIAEALGLAPRTVDRHWAYSRAWLEREIKNRLND